jgi:hypothetical protein
MTPIPTLVLLACAGASPSAGGARTSPTTEAAQPTTEHVTARLEAVDVPAAPPPDALAGPLVPEAYREVAELLTAFHAEDLPDRTTVAAHPEAGPALIWLSEHASPDGRRARALGLLGYVDDAAARAHLVAVASRTDMPRLVRAGALEGIAHWPSDDRRAQALTLRECLRTHDPVLVGAAERAATGIIELEADVRAARDALRR